MADTAAPKLSPINVLIDATLVIAAFALFFWLAMPHVPSEDPRQIALWSAFCSSCMSGVFWIAWQMLKSVYRHQRAAARTSE